MLFLVESNATVPAPVPVLRPFKGDLRFFFSRWNERAEREKERERDRVRERERGRERDERE